MNKIKKYSNIPKTKKQVRKDRLKFFKNLYLETIKSQRTVIEYPNHMYKIYVIDDIYIDFYPMADRMLDCKTGQWMDNALDWIINNIIEY